MLLFPRSALTEKNKVDFASTPLLCPGGLIQCASFVLIGEPPLAPAFSMNTLTWRTGGKKSKPTFVQEKFFIFIFFKLLPINKEKKNEKNMGRRVSSFMLLSVVVKHSVIVDVLSLLYLFHVIRAGL